MPSPARFPPCKLHIPFFSLFNYLFTVLVWWSPQFDNSLSHLLCKYLIAVNASSILPARCLGWVGMGISFFVVTTELARFLFFQPVGVSSLSFFFHHLILFSWSPARQPPSLCSALRILIHHLRPSIDFRFRFHESPEQLIRAVEKFSVMPTPYLRIFCNQCQSDWAEWLFCAEYALDKEVNASTGYSPFFLNYGCDPPRPLFPISRPPTNAPKPTSSLNKCTLWRRKCLQHSSSRLRLRKDHTTTPIVQQPVLKLPTLKQKA